MKIASLLPSATEIVCALGLKDRLVAVSHECDFPAGVSSLPHITSSILPHDLNAKGIDKAVVDAVLAGQALYKVNGDLLAELKPDLIVTQGVCDVCAVNQETVDETLKFVSDVIPKHIKVLSLSGQNFAGVCRDIMQVAAATDTEPVGAELVSSLKASWKALADEDKPFVPPRVMMLEWPDPPFYGGHWVPEMVHAAGGIDVMGQEGLDSKRCTWEEIAATDPDYIFVMGCGYNLDQNLGFAKALRDHPIAGQLRAVQHGRVWACDANSYFSRPAPRLLEGAQLLRMVFNGETPPDTWAKPI